MLPSIELTSIESIAVGESMAPCWSEMSAKGIDKRPTRPLVGRFIEIRPGTGVHDVVVVGVYFEGLYQTAQLVRPGSSAISCNVNAIGLSSYIPQIFILRIDTYLQETRVPGMRFDRLPIEMNGRAIELCRVESVAWPNSAGNKDLAVNEQAGGMLFSDRPHRKSGTESPCLRII